MNCNTTFPTYRHCKPIHSYNPYFHPVRAKRKTAVAILVPQFSYFNFHMNFSCKLSVYIYICFLCMKIENKLYSILFYSQVRHALHKVVYLYSHIEHKELISNPTIATLWWDLLVSDVPRADNIGGVEWGRGAGSRIRYSIKMVFIRDSISEISP